MKFEKFLKVVVVGELIGVGCMIVRDLVATTKSSPDASDDYEDSYEAGYEAGFEAATKQNEDEESASAFEMTTVVQQEMVQTALDLASNTVARLVEVLQSENRAVIDLLWESNRDLMDLHADILKELSCGIGCRCGGNCGEHDDCDGCSGCGNCDGCGQGDCSECDKCDKCGKCGKCGKCEECSNGENDEAGDCTNCAGESNDRAKSSVEATDPVGEYLDE